MCENTSEIMTNRSLLWKVENRMFTYDLEIPTDPPSPEIPHSPLVLSEVNVALPHGHPV